MTPVDKNIECFEVYKMNPRKDLFYAMSHGVNRAILKEGIEDSRVKFLDKLVKKIPNIKVGVEKRIIWSDKKNIKTPIAIIYIHGFTASSEEARPLPDLLAKNIRSNIFYARLTGHGRNEEAMASSNQHVLQVVQASGQHSECLLGLPLLES